MKILVFVFTLFQGRSKYIQVKTGSNLKWRVFLTTGQFRAELKIKIPYPKIDKKKFKIYFEKRINQIILFCG